MSTVQNVDYAKIPGIVNNMVSKAEEINKKINGIYSNVGNMSSSWYGNRYNELVRVFNQFIGNVNDNSSGIMPLLNLITKTLPEALLTVGENYAKFDNVSFDASARGNLRVIQIQSIAESKNEGMKFEGNVVESVRQNVAKDFEKVLTLLNGYLDEFNKISWDSDVSANFKNTLKQMIASISSSISAINGKFTSLMQAAYDQLKEAETSNDVGNN